jgi:MFS family permease
LFVLPIYTQIFITIAWIGSFSIGIQYIFCFVGGILIEIFSARKIGMLGALISTISLFSTAFVTNLKLYLLTYGFIFGIGQAFLLAATEAILPHYFKKRLSLANGFMIFVSAFVIVALPFFTSMILERYALRETFFFLAALNSVAILTTASFKSQLPRPRVETSVWQKVKESVGDMVLFKNVKYICWLLATFIAMFGYLIPIVNIDHHSLKVFPHHKPYYNNIIFGIASAFGGLLFGKFGDLTRFSKLFYHAVALLTYGLVQLTIPLAPSPLVFMIQYAILGLIDGIYLAYIVPIAYDLAYKSHKRTNQAIGTHFFFLIAKYNTFVTNELYFCFKKRFVLYHMCVSVDTGTGDSRQDLRAFS